MKHFKLFITEEKSGKVHKMLPERPEDPDVLVKGVGVYRLSSLKKNVSDKIKDLYSRSTSGDFDLIFKQISDKKSILRHMVQAVIEVEAELKTPQMKRKITIMKKKKK